jgi:hypothetical protein
MTSKISTRFPAFSVRFAPLKALLVAGILVAGLAGSLVASAQTPAASRFLGTITGISGTALSVKTDAGDVRQVDVPAAASIKRIAPGQKDLSTAETIQFSDLASGDRVLVRLDPDSQTQASQIIAIKQADVAQKQEKDREDWQRRGVGGLVKSVDSGAGVIVLTTGSGTTAKTISVNTSKATILKRYAPASVSFDTAVTAPITAIQAGDQLRARGEKNADGTQIVAEEVISGTFRNISGTVTSLDPATSTLVVKDLSSKKQVTIHITPAVQMRKLPDMMARALAARLNGASGGGGYGGGRSGGVQAGNGGGAAAGGGSGQRGGAQGGGDPQQFLNRAPVIQLADLKKGDAVMLVSTDGATEVTAITLLAGVEPLLEAPAASQSLLNNWSMAGGSGAAEAAAQ